MKREGKRVEEESNFHHNQSAPELINKNYLEKNTNEDRFSIIMNLDYRFKCEERTSNELE